MEELYSALYQWIVLYTHYGNVQNSVCSVCFFQKLQLQTLLNNLIVSRFWSLEIWDIMVNIDTKGTTT